MTFKEAFEQMDKQDTTIEKKQRFKIETLEIAGFASSLKALRLPFGLECRSKTNAEYYKGETEPYRFATVSFTEVEPKDLHLLSTLVKRGDEHAKVIRGIVVYAEISAPIWFYRELETYVVGRVRLSSESTMHIDCKGLGGEELEKAKDNIPMGHIQRTIDMYSYQTLRRIYIQRRNHRLPIWREFCQWIESLPFANELILVGLKDGNSSTDKKM
jgi:hypothetical protein